MSKLADAIIDLIDAKFELALALTDLDDEGYSGACIAETEAVEAAERRFRAEMDGTPSV